MKTTASAVYTTQHAQFRDYFTGKERDTESGNDYFGARYYASSMGRFMSADPSGLLFADPTNPQSLNLYNYGLNNPFVNVDPNGLDCIHKNVDTGAYEGFESGDCDNSTEEKANSGQYVDGTVSTIYTSTGDSSGVVTGYSATNYHSGALISGTFVQLNCRRVKLWRPFGIGLSVDARKRKHNLCEDHCG
jgi:RHS repeat-associated protein